MNSEHIDSLTNYNYITFKVTKSRIDKGLLAIPKSLADEYFPPNNSKIRICFEQSMDFEIKNYTCFTSSSREARIGGMKEWYQSNKIRNGDEIVIQIIDHKKLKYKILPERCFLNEIKQLQKMFDSSKNENEARECLSSVSKLVGVDRNNIVFNEALRLTELPIKERKHSIIKNRRSKESVPSSLRSLLEEIYHGHCQLTNFGFIMRNGRPYFEIHHINPNLGDHIKNLLVVCPNVHAQFTYANVYHKFDNEGWLCKVRFNNTEFNVNQKIRNYKEKKFIKQVYL